MNITLIGITKRFPGVVANDAIALEITGGEVHCLLGENGAGKSTLIDILAGLQQPDAGSMEIDGARVEFASPAESIAHGIGVVHQHSTLIPSFTVLENLMLGERGGISLDRRTAALRLAEISATLGAEIHPDRRAGDLGLGEQQQVELVKALWRGSRVLVLDEPTSMLVPQAVEGLMRSIERLRAGGIAVVLVTHKLHEAIRIGDRVTVLRGGRVAGRITKTEMHGEYAQVEQRMLAAMFGEERGTRSATARPGERGGRDLGVGEETGSAAVGNDVTGTEAAGSEVVDRDPVRFRSDARGALAAAVVLRVEALTTVADAAEVPVTGIDLEIRAGEILGIAGVDGHGQRHLAEAIAGQRIPSRGRVLLDGVDITRRGVKARQRLGVRYVTDDRLHEGIVGELSVALNLVLKRIGDAPLWRFGRMDRAAVAAEADERIAAYDIRTPSREARAGTLSGGNIQKILLARELAGEPRIVVFNKPTHGLDLKTVAHVRAAVREFADGGGAVLLISTDLEELSELADRILVLSNGRVAGEVAAGTAERALDASDSTVAERVGELMIGTVRRVSSEEAAE